MDKFEQMFGKQITEHKDKDSVMMVAILHLALIKVVGFMAEKFPNENPPPEIDALLTISAERVKEYYKDKEITTISDFQGSTTLQ